MNCMASDKTRAALAFVKVLIALGAGYAIFSIWVETRGYDDPLIPYGPYVAGVIVTVMVFLLLSKLSKGSGND